MGGVVPADGVGGAVGSTSTTSDSGQLMFNAIHSVQLEHIVDYLM